MFIKALRVWALNPAGTRSIKNFGHARHKTPVVTVVWHSVLTALFIGTLLDWNRCKEPLSENLIRDCINVSLYLIFTNQGGWKIPIDIEGMIGDDGEVPDFGTNKKRENPNFASPNK